MGVCIRDALRSGFMAIMNSMAAIGLVSLPGMMTGQILAVVEPVDVVKYQLLIMFLIARGTGLGTPGRRPGWRTAADRPPKSAASRSHRRCEIRQRGGKRVIAFAVEGDVDVQTIRSNTFESNGRRKADG
jgi:Uncharacterised protein family (UPF0014)